MTPGPDRRRIVVLGKAPIRGFVKTRLAADVGETEALRIHELLARRTFDAVVGTGIPAEARIAPDDAVPGLTTWVPSPVRVRAQGSGDLGARIRRAFEDAFAEGAARVVVTGTDCPGLTAAHLLDAFAALDDADAVVGPATDGGYWAVGARGATPDLFRGVPWSTPEVLAATRRRAASSGLRLAELGTLADVDTLADWRRATADPGAGSLPIGV